MGEGGLGEGALQDTVISRTKYSRCIPIVCVGHSDIVTQSISAGVAVFCVLLCTLPFLGGKLKSGVRCVVRIIKPVSVSL